MELLGNLTVGFHKMKGKGALGSNQERHIWRDTKHFQGWVTDQESPVRRTKSGRKAVKEWFQSLGWLVLSCQGARGSGSRSVMGESGEGNATEYRASQFPILVPKYLGRLV